MSTERSRNEEAYQRLRDSLEQEYRGQFVVIAHGKLVAAGPTLEKAVAQAEAVAPQATHRLVVKVGEEYPSSVTIGAS
jgi:hypothetical protein